VTLEENLWGLDDEMELKAAFEPNYSGPLRLTNYAFIQDSFSNLFRVQRSSIELEGEASGASIRYFAATTDLKYIVPARVRPSELEFQFPEGADVEDTWLFVTTYDSEGTYASVGVTFGVAPELREIELAAYNPSSPYADVLVECVRMDGPLGQCNMEKLPYLGLESSNPGIADIMKRTVVSHNWMGKNFRSVLEILPGDFFKQFRGVTAVVIAANIRPSFFNPVTGVIHIDPASLWLTETELNTISDDPDYRAGFGSGLNFIDHWEYEFLGGSAWVPFNPNTQLPFRSVAQIVFPFSTVLIHELAHANDSAPPMVQAQLDSNHTPLDVLIEFEGVSPSINLLNTYPLGSSLLRTLAGVMFAGEEASQTILSLSAEEIGQAFEPDGATDLYNYFTPFEDTAMMVEEVLSYHFFGIRRVVTFLEVPDVPNPSCDDYIVAWGQRGRAGDEDIQERARLVLTGLLDEADVSQYLDDLSAPYQMETGTGYCNSFQAMPNFAHEGGGLTTNQYSNPSIPGQFRAPRGPFHQKDTPLSGKTFLRQGGGGLRH